MNSSHKKKSGCENRKRKKEMEEKVKKLQKMDAFCIPIKPKTVENEVSTVIIMICVFIRLFFSGDVEITSRVMVLSKNISDESYWV